MVDTSINSITEYSLYRIKKCALDSIFAFIGIIAILFINIEALFHIEWIKIGKIVVEEKNFFNAFFYTVFIVGITINIGLIALIIYFIISMIKEYKKIEYYKINRFSLFEEKEIEFDYKLWQTAPKNSFHSQVVKMEIDGEEKEFKTPIIFTNSKRIGLFKIPKILQSHSYVRGKALIGFDKEKNEAVILEVRV